MNFQILPDIPRIYTAIAEWIACLIYIIPLKKRIEGALLYTVAGGTLLLLIITQSLAGMLPIVFWIPGMLMAMAIMYLFIYLSCDMSFFDAGYCFARAFISAEFVASLEWQLYFYLSYVSKNNSWQFSAIVMVVIYGIVFVGIFFIDSHKMPKNTKLGIRARELSSAMLMTFATFLMSNINFVIQDSIFGNSVGSAILYIRTLVDFSGLTMLFVQREQRREIQLKNELDAMNHVLNRQYEQYQQSKESIEILNLKYHDLKHMISSIRSERDPDKKESYITEMEEAIQVYEAQYKTGNNVLDTVLTGKSLYCAQNSITLTCMADGGSLSFMSVADLCTIFGNALDNAIESVEKLEEEKRLICVSVFKQNNFLMLRFENYFRDALKFEDGLPATTKENRQYHGYGIKSIRRTIEKYGGTLTIHTKNHWFIMLILIPLSDK
jgi:hypothetical protein